MKIELTKIFIRDLIDGYENNDEEGVVAYHGLLNVRPKYQREFIYNEKEQKAVIDTVLHGFPLNTMYWVKNSDGTFEVLDGQQRTLSICEYAEHNFYYNLDGKDMLLINIKRAYPEMYERFMNYELLVYICEGTKEEQLKWFTTINIAGKALTNQELRNINYTGSWLTSAKSYFSKTNCPAAQIASVKGSALVSGEYNRQDVLEQVLCWITDTRNTKDMNTVCQYMAKHQDDENANELWQYFSDVIDWVKELFPNYRAQMKGIDWGFLYNDYHENEYDPDELEAKIEELLANEEVTKQKGIYQYLFDNDEKHLSIRKFPDAIRNRVYARQKGICPICGEKFSINKMEADHIIPWSKGGKTIESNCQMLCKQCNKDKSSRD